MRTTRLDQARTRLSVVDQVRALQAEPARTQVAELDCRRVAQLLLQRCTPLLDVLCRRVKFESGETHDRSTQNRGWKVQRGDAGNKRIALRRQREYVGYVVTLVAPGVHVNRRVKNAVGQVRHDSEPRHVLSQAEPGRKVGMVGIHQALWIPVLPSNEDLRSSAAEVEIAVGVADVYQRAHEFIAQPVGKRGGCG